MTQITLNAGQQAAADSFLHFLVTDETEMVISGSAGVGKSTLLAHMMSMFSKGQALSNVLGSKGLGNMRLTATTNKAAEVLAKMIGAEVTTIHSALGLRIYDDYKTGKTILTPTGDPDEPQIFDELIVIDECSMVNAELYGYLFRRTQGCKFLYIGDHCQLAPVNEQVSKVFQRGLRTEHLTEIVRSKNAPNITLLCNALREGVENGTFFQIPHVPGSIEYLDDAQMLAKIDEHFIKPNPLESRILCYTNKRVNQFNKLIRSQRGLPETLTVGEKVVANSGLEISKGNRIYVEEEIEILDVDMTYRLIHELECYRVLTSHGWVVIPKNPLEVSKKLQEFKRAKNWEDFFNIKNNFGDFRPRDASTVYKAQGSTYDVAFIDIGDIGTCNIPHQVARMLYVANSRPRSKIYLFGQLPYKYRGGMP